MFLDLPDQHWIWSHSSQSPISGMKSVGCMDVWGTDSSLDSCLGVVLEGSFTASLCTVWSLDTSRPYISSRSPPISEVFTLPPLIWLESNQTLGMVWHSPQQQAQCQNNLQRINALDCKNQDPWSLPISAVQQELARQQAHANDNTCRYWNKAWEALCAKTTHDLLHAEKAQIYNVAHAKAAQVPKQKQHAVEKALKKAKAIPNKYNTTIRSLPQPTIASANPGEPSRTEWEEADTLEDVDMENWLLWIHSSFPPTYYFN